MNIEFLINDSELGAHSRPQVALLAGEVPIVLPSNKLGGLSLLGGTLDNFGLLPATAVAASTSKFVTLNGTGTEIIAQAVKGGCNIKTQATTPADNDNVFLAAVASTGFHRTIGAGTNLVFDSAVNITSVADGFWSFGLNENVTDVDPTGTAGDGAMFCVDPTGEFATALDADRVVGNWFAFWKVDGFDYGIDTGIPAQAGVDYHLRIELGADLKPRFYINGDLVATGAALTSGDSLKVFAGGELTTGTNQRDADIRYLYLGQKIG